MTQYESIEPDKVKEIFAKFFAIDKRTGEIRTCSGLECVDCLFHSVNSCRVEKMKWLDRPAFDPEKDIDWAKVPVDTPVLVWNRDTETECRRHFYELKCAEPYIFRTFAAGKTSWTAYECDRSDWKHCKLYRQEDIEKYRKKGTENG